MSKNGFQLIDVRKSFGAAQALKGVSFEVKAGEFVTLLGPSGAGKTTLFRCLTGLERADHGETWVLGERIDLASRKQLRALRQSIGLIFQQHNLIGRLSALDNVLMARLSHTPWWRVALNRFSHRDKQLALSSLDQVGLLDKAYIRSDALSGGQQQRVAIARVLTQHSKVLLADEPVASLDPESARLVLEDLKRIAKEHNIAVLCSLHQVNLAKKYADRIIGMRAGELVFDGSSKDFCAQTEQRLYAKAHSGIPADENHSTV